MISERQFSTTFTSFWAEVTPLGETLIRVMNLALERFDPPIRSEVNVRHNGFINELGFRIAENAFLNRVTLGDNILAKKLYHETETYIRRLPRPALPDSDTEQSAAISDAVRLGNRLLSAILVMKGDRDVLFRPSFRGCGIHDDCEGDLLVGSEIWEVKSGDRQFRQPDIRQLLTYCTLNHASGRYRITDYRFINPRAGVTFCGSLHDIVRTVAGCEPETLYGEIVEFLSRAEVSI